MTHSGLLLAQAPFFRLLIALCLGAVIPTTNSYPILVICMIMLLLFLIYLVLTKNCSFSKQPFWGLMLLVCVFLIGIIRGTQQNQSFRELSRQEYFVILDEFPMEKENSWQIQGELANFGNNILVYLPKTASPFDASPGQILSFIGKPQKITNDGNPFEFDYCSYLANKNIGYRIFLKENQYCFLKGDKRLNLFRIALIIRNRLIQCLDRSGMSGENVHLISSISYGAREEVDKETIQSFTNTGVIHVLAVSGMNVGLIFVILDFLFRFLKRFKAGTILHFLIMLGGIWSYALITGMSPSIMRAALMFSFVLLGTVVQRKSNIYNSLAVSAFFLIVWNPNIIRDVGFQLSYAAVLSIVVIQPFIYKCYFFKNWVFNNIWLLLTVTFAAQAGTLPITLLYFHQFPVYFWLANLVVIPLVTLILYLSFVLILFSFLSTFLTSVFAWILDWAVNLVLLSVNFVESLPYAVLKNLYPSSLEILLALAIAFFVYRYFVFRKMGYFSGALLLLFLLFSSLISDMYIRRTRSELVFFNISGVRALSVTRGTSSIVLYDRCENPSKKLGYCLNPYLGKRGIKKFDFFKLNDTLRISGDDFLVVANLIYFKGKKIYIQTNNGFNLSHREAETEFDLVWLDYSKTLPQNMSFAQIVLHNPSQTLDSKPKSIRLSQFVKMDKSFQIAYNRPIWGDSEGWYTGCFKPGK